MVGPEDEYSRKVAKEAHAGHRGEGHPLHPVGDQWRQHGGGAQRHVGHPEGRGAEGRGGGAWCRGQGRWGEGRDGVAPRARAPRVGRGAEGRGGRRGTEGRAVKRGAEGRGAEGRGAGWQEATGDPGASYIPRPPGQVNRLGGKGREITKEVLREV